MPLSSIVKGIGGFLTNPRVGAAYNFGRLAVSTGSSFFSNRSTANIYAGAEPMFRLSQSLQRKGYEDEAHLLDRQAEIAVDESVRDAMVIARDAHKLREEQALAYSASGVLLEGSPLLMLEETRQQAAQEIDATIKHGLAVGELYRRKGLITRNEGLASVLNTESDFSARKTAGAISAIGTGGFAQALSGLGNLLGGGSTAIPGKKKPKKSKTTAYGDDGGLLSPGVTQIPGSPTSKPAYSPSWY